MNCNLCKQELEGYREGKLPEGIEAQVKAHLEGCSDCAAIYQMEMVANRVIIDEKQVQSNPFLVTRIMAEIETLEQLSKGSERIPVYKKVLKPVLVTITVAASILIGVLVGNVYQPASDSNKIPVELTYMNDAALESVDLVANN
jgi:predicted anti-sigma-YlaC factor YlaD